jgi:UDP-N-acetyl-D-galactosamine dehydrogenase
MGKYVATEVIKLMMRKNLKIINSNVLILGFTFKEDCPDVRNTRVIDIYQELINFDIKVDVFDPWANREEVMQSYNINILSKDVNLNKSHYSAIILAVAHKEFLNLNISTRNDLVVFDVKGILAKSSVDGRL